MPDNKVVLLQDIIDYSICPMRLWWKSGRIDPALVGPSNMHTASDLLERSVKSALLLYYSTAIKNPDATLQLAHSHIWKKWLEGWGVGYLIPELEKYNDIRSALIEKVPEKSNKYRTQPTPVYWQRSFLDLANKSGLVELMISIDKHHEEINLPVYKINGNTPFRGQIGLAEAYARSKQITSNNFDSLPIPQDVIGVLQPITVDLFTTTLEGWADIVYIGKKSKKTGESIPVIYELHDYDEIPLSIPELYSDIRVLTAFEGFPKVNDSNSTEYRLEMVVYRHMISGVTHLLKPEAKSSKDYLEGLATAVNTAVHSGIIVPRKIYGGIGGCGSCELIPICRKAQIDVVKAYNPTLLERGKLSYALFQKLDQLYSRDKELFILLKSILEMINSSPEIEVENILWALDTIRGNRDED